MTTDVHLHDPQTLYRHWEGEQWSPWDVELDADRQQWQGALSEEDRGLVYWALSSLMVAEERITTKFAGLVMAGASEEETTFLATQQVEDSHFGHNVIASCELPPDCSQRRAVAIEVALVAAY